MDVQTKRYRFVGNFIVVYLLIVSLLSAVFIFSFNLYRDHITRFEVGLETGTLVAEPGPLIEQSLGRGDTFVLLRPS